MLPLLCLHLYSTNFLHLKDFYLMDLPHKMKRYRFQRKPPNSVTSNIHKLI
uniref:Uncharacterized protein n=1 Tax=Meloidogyne enterolobii TaxID=390850 RepID=A0A6V7X9S5_MELEN|nr:unnamed protein product [Meloidogyne enterolobii]